MNTYLTVLTTDHYLIGLLALHKSLMSTNPKYDFVVLITDNITKQCEHTLNKINIKTIRVNRLTPMIEKSEERQNKRRNNFSKLLMFGLTQYDKIVFLDSDMLIMQNLDHLFQKSHLAAVAAGSLFPGHEHWKQLNSGLMVIKPETGLASTILTHLPEVEKNNKSFGDQKLIAAHYPDWVNDSKLHLDHKFNMFIGTIQYHVDKYNYNLNFKRPDNKTIAVIHFIGSIKPWMKSSKEQLATIRTHEKKGNLVDAKMIAHYYNLIN